MDDVAASASRSSGGASGRPRSPLLLGLTRNGVVLVGVGPVLLLGFGLWLVHLGHFGYGAGWIDAAIALYFVTFALGTRQSPKSCAPCSTDRVSRAENYTSLLVVLVILVLMVFKP